jgi:hypothetical protein
MEQESITPLLCMSLARRVYIKRSYVVCVRPHNSPGAEITWSFCLNHSTTNAKSRDEPTPCVEIELEWPGAMVRLKSDCSRRTSVALVAVLKIKSV